ncbi:uncharacterized protein BJ212DRAFT_1484839 [Suillus subaureus]|uniref:ATP-citrate synthase citrate-binding domain-containing protein n=1 Tax=Suillus subaureus TaxID=48587 RepID=A0A9P7E2E8_9AGAM|nr:uncharacterized protein BJ212DRAFT_1484839 [Suillus subaureus]KAG1808986.1 hypothetical protein BJ212DRAFT_1484839 [Suillus subaureus]
MAVNSTPVNCEITDCVSDYISTNLQTILLREVPAYKKEILTDFSFILYLDMAAKLGQTAESICSPKWTVARDSTVYQTAPAATTTGSKINDDRAPSTHGLAHSVRQRSHNGRSASLKLTVLNPTSRVWAMVAGGGVSIVYSDAITAAGFTHELANDGECSGAPSEGQTFEYAKTIPVTFKGTIHTLTSCKSQLIAHNANIYVRRGGPNWQEGLNAMHLLGESLGIPIRVSGPGTHITETSSCPQFLRSCLLL